MGELIQLSHYRLGGVGKSYTPKPPKFIPDINRLYGSVVLEPWSHMFNADTVIDRLLDESDHGTMTEGTYIQVCDDLNIGAETAGEMFVRLKAHGILNFI